MNRLRLRTDSAFWPALYAGLAAFAVGLSFLVFDIDGGASRMREEAFDTLSSAIAPKRAEERVVVVDIDRASLADKGRWPWRRAALATLVAHIQKARAKVIGIDILLDGPDRRAPGPIVRALIKEGGLTQLQDLAKTIPDDDKELADTIANSDVVLGLVLDDVSRDAPPFPTTIVAMGTRPPQFGMASARGVAAPLPGLADSALAIGALSLFAGPGDKVRSAPVFVRGKDDVYAGFAMEVFRAAQGSSAFVLESDGQTITVGERKLSLREGAFMRLHLAAPGTWSARTVSAADVLDGKVPDERFAGHIVLIGTSAPEAGALLATAVSPLTPTVQLQAETVEQLNAGDIPLRIRDPRIVEPAVAIGLGLLALAAALWLGPFPAAAVLGAIVLAWLGISAFMFGSMRLLIDPIGPLVPAIAAALTALLVLFARTRKLRQAIEHKFGRYLSPEIVRRLTAAPEELKIEGELREVTALFSDIEGFTTMSEHAGPRMLVGALDAYFEGVCAIVIRHGGMVDKIVGDAVHGLFNAPLDLPHHARAALDCAIEIGRFTTAFRERDDAKELRFGRTRIGFETGPVIVGDVGGLGHLDYTAHGDAVNSAARLEAINKQFGTTICLGARAAAAIDQPERLRQLGTVTLRGRAAATAVYGPWPDDATPECRAAYENAYRLIASDRPAAHAAFVTLAQLWPSDPAVAYWLRELGGSSSPAAA